jgi:hypothetical protein
MTKGERGFVASRDEIRYSKSPGKLLFCFNNAQRCSMQQTTKYASLEATAMDGDVSPAAAVLVYALVTPPRAEPHQRTPHKNIMELELGVPLFDRGETNS